MTPDRQAHLERVIATAKCRGELEGIRGQLALRDELVAPLVAAIARRKAELGKGARA